MDNDVERAFLRDAVTPNAFGVAKADAPEMEIAKMTADESFIV